MGVSLSNDFSSLIDNFDYTRNSLKITSNLLRCDNSSGATFTNINAALSSYNKIKSECINLFDATSFYLNKARTNIEECELDNSKE